MATVTGLFRRGARIAREWKDLGKPALPSDPLKPMVQDSSIAVPLGYPVAPSKYRGRKIAIFLHAFYGDIMAEEIARAMTQFPVPADLFITTDTKHKKDCLSAALEYSYNAGAIDIAVIPNRGRDIWPKFGFRRGDHEKYDYVLHLHTKHSPHREQLKAWRHFLWEHLASPQAVLTALEVFERNPDVGMVSAQHQQYIRNFIGWGGNKENCEDVAQRMGVPTPLPEMIDFPSGSMFWARTEALKPLLDLDLKEEDFPDESGQLDNTLAHAIERLLYLSCEKAGYKWVRLAIPKWHSVKTNIQTVSHPIVLKRFVALRTAGVLPTPPRTVSRA